MSIHLSIISSALILLFFSFQLSTFNTFFQFYVRLQNHKRYYCFLSNFGHVVVAKKYATNQSIFFFYIIFPDMRVNKIKLERYKVLKKICYHFNLFVKLWYKILLLLFIREFVNCTAHL